MGTRTSQGGNGNPQLFLPLPLLPDALVRLLQADQATRNWISAEEVSTPQAWTWGPVRVARHLFVSLALGPILDRTTRLLHHGQPSRNGFPAAGESLDATGQ